jgi:hypothetical protein
MATAGAFPFLPDVGEVDKADSYADDDDDEEYGDHGRSDV